MTRCLRLVLLLLAVSVYAQAQAPSYSAPASWLKTYDEFTKRNEALTKKRAEFERKVQPEVDSLVGMSQRLLQQIPQGYQFDPSTRTFAPVLPPPTPASAPTKGASE